jgi:hypothetical protein
MSSRPSERSEREPGSIPSGRHETGALEQQLALSQTTVAGSRLKAGTTA